MANKNKLFDKFLEENPEFPVYIINQAKAYLDNKASDADVKRILENLKLEYEDSLVTYNEAIGVITAQSVGEPSTQMTLNTFHFAGVSTQSVEGLPRLIEILDAKKNLEAPMMKLYLKKKDSTEDQLKIVADKIRETKLLGFVNNVDIDIDGNVVKLELDIKKLKKLKINTESLVSCFDKSIRKSSEIVDGKLVVVKGASTPSLKNLMGIKEIALSSIVYGIKGIKDVSLIKEDGEFVIITKGVAIRQVELIDEIDLSRIYSNDIQKVFDVYGIEAARQVIINEFMEVVKSQGLTINERHVLLIADIMTYNGEIKGMTRYGVVNDKQNVLTRASFETPLRHIASGALLNEEDELNTITENVMTNQIVRVGTGMPKVSIKKGK